MIHQLSMFMQTAPLSMSGDLWILIGIALAACVLGIEVACIAILIRKVNAAKREKLAREEEERRGDMRGMAMMGAFSLSFSAETVLAVLLGLAAVAAVVFTVLLLVFRSKGYDYAAVSAPRKSSEMHSEPISSEVKGEETAPVELPPELPEEPAEETEELTVEFDEIFGEEAEAVSEETESAEELVAQESAEELLDGDEESELVFEIPEEAEEPSVAAYAEQEEPVDGMEPVAEEADAEDTVASGTKDAPVRVVTIEKTTTVKTETTKEIKDPAEAQGNAAMAGASSEQAERIIQILGTLAEKIDSVHLDAVVQASQNVTVLNEDEPLPTEEDEDEEELNGAEDPTDADEEDGDSDEENERFTGNERIIGYDEATGNYIVAHYRKSFEAKLIQSKPAIKHYYSELKNALMAYKGTKSRTSWTADSFHNGRSPIAKINVKTNILEIYLALDPASLENTVYRGKDVGHLKKYTDTPFKYRLKTERKFRWALELIQRTCEEHGLSPIDIETVDYEAKYAFEETEALVARGLIKEYIREQKAANSFELDETHVPTVVDVDETVIPSSANIMWEFDNEVLSQKPMEESEESSEEIEEAPVEEAPVVREEPVRETVVTETTEEITKVRYTEEFYGSSDTPIRTVNEAIFRGEFSIPEEEAAETEATDFVAFDTEADGSMTEASFEETFEKMEEAEEEVSEAEAAEENDLMSAFEEDHSAVADPEDELDWGIPAELLSQPSVVIEAAEEQEILEEPAEDTDYSEEEIDYAETEEGGVADGEEYEESAEAEEAYEEATDAELEDTAEGEETGYYDENGEWVEYAAEGEETGYYDENGEWVEYAAEGEETGYYDENGEWIEYASEEAYEEPAPEPEPMVRSANPDVALVDVAVIEANFPEGSEVDLEALKAKGLVMPSAKYLKIYKSGELTKPYTIVANQFTRDALFAICAVDGDAQTFRK